jgi:hypothetical protein
MALDLSHHFPSSQMIGVPAPGGAAVLVGLVDTVMLAM